MIKKAFILFAVILLSEILVGCFYCKPKDYHLNLTEIKSQIFELRDTTICSTTQDTIKCIDSYNEIEKKDSAIILNNEFRIGITLRTNENTAYNFPSVFLNQSYACQENEYLGLAVPITKLEIRCNHDVLNTKAGELIANEKMEFHSLYTLVPNLSVDEWINKISEKDGLYYIYYLGFKEDIISDEYLTFDISVILQNGQKFSTTTIPVKIIE